jgi:hypothetical protein
MEQRRADAAHHAALARALAARLLGAHGERRAEARERSLNAP